MSGIYGIFYKNGAPVTSETLQPLKVAMAEWGPDNEGIWFNGSVGLGHSMLHTTPESLNEQLPTAHPHDPNWIITADARIDNREDLLAELKINPATDIPDSTLILLAYERWGQTCINKLIGDFSFVIWDQREQLLFCGRDIIGCKPFYYYDNDDCFAFASDIEGLLAHPEVPERLNEALLASYLQQSTSFAGKRYTFLSDIVKIPPAHTLVITENKSQLTRYWSLDNVRDIRLPSNEAYAEQLRELLFQAVKCRLRTHFPVGAHLSGGLDSSTVTAIAARLLREQKRNLTTYSWLPPPSPGKTTNDVQKLVELLCEQESLQCQHINLKVEDVLRHYTSDFIRHPTDSLMLQEELTQRQAAQNHVRIMLSGWGGDEVITGHGWGYWSGLFLNGRWWKLHKEILSGLRLTELSGIRKAKGYASIFYRKALLPAIPEFAMDCLHGRHYHSYPKSFIQKDFAAQYEKAVRALRGPSLLERGFSVRKMQWRWLNNGHLTSRIEAWAINGARKNIVYNYPLLDRRILEFGLGVPPDQFVQQGWKRSLIRRAVEGILPEDIQWRRSKLEPVNFDHIENVMIQALPRLFDTINIDKSHLFQKYVDLEKISSFVKQVKVLTLELELLYNAVGLVNILQNNK